MKNGIEIKITWDLRPCVVNGRRALFHRWEDYAEVVGESPLMGGHAAGQLSCCLGLVEYEDGTIAKVHPGSIKFVDGVFQQYAFRDETGSCTA